MGHYLCRLVLLPGDGPADDRLPHVGRALVDLADAHVAVDAFDREVIEIAVAAEGLDGVGADALGKLFQSARRR